MKNSIVAKVYAQAVVKLAEEKSCPIFSDITAIIDLLNHSPMLEQVLFLKVFTEIEKNQILNDVLVKLEINQLTKNFLLFLLAEKRLSLLPQIYKELITIEDASKGFMKVYVEGPLDQLELKAQASLEKYLLEKLGYKSSITYKKNEKISAGYQVSAGDYLLDATLKTQLNSFKNTFFE